MTNNKVGLKLSTIVTSVLLASCGGGGSDGYYGGESSNNNQNGTGTGGNQTAIKEASALVLSSFDKDGKSKTNINRNGDTLIVKLQAVDKDGGGVKDKKVKLSITDFQKFGITSDASEKITDADGYAIFTVTVPKITQDIQKITITGTVVGTSISQVSLIGVSGSTESIAQSKLEAVFDPINAINVTGGTAVIKVRAKDVNGGGVANQKIALAIPKALQNEISIAGTSEVITDENGYSTFNIKLVNGKEINRQELLKNGVLLTATLTDTEGAVASQNTTLQVRSAVGLVDKVIFDTNLSNNKIAASNGNATIKIKVLNPEGLPVKKQKVKLEIVDTVKNIDGFIYTENAATRGANIINPMVDTDEEGFATFTVTIAANEKNVQQILAEWGVNLKATVTDSTNKTVTQQHRLTAVSNMNESVTQLAFLSQQLDITEGSGKVVIKAIDEYGGAVAGQNITLKINGSDQLGVVSNSSSSLTSDAKGEVTFDLAFTKLNDEDTFKELMAKGLTVVATHVNTKNQTVSQTHNIKLTSQNNNTSSTVERIQITSNVGTVAATGNNKVKFTITAFNGDGTKAINQRIGLGLNEVALQNGVTFTQGQTVTTNAQGNATFEVNVNAQNLDAITNLVRSGITLAANYKRTDGTSVTQVYRVAVTEPAVAETLVDQLIIKPSATNISGLGGEVTVVVQAVDINGKGLEGKTLTLGLPNSVSSRVQVDNSTAVTNAQGYAYFKLSVTSGTIDEALVKAGITYAITAINTSNGSIKTQANKLAVVVPEQALDVSLSTIRNSVSEDGDSLDINIKVSSADIAVTGYPVAMEVIDGNLTGVKLNAISYTVDANGNAKATLTVPAGLTEAQRQKLITDGINIKATITLPNGEKRGKVLKLQVKQVMNQNHLAISLNKNSMVNIGENSLVTVKLLDPNNGGVANQPIQLKVAGNTAVSINGASTQMTNEFGEAVFEVKLTQTTDLSAITLLATNTNSASKTIQQIGVIGVHQATSLAPLLDLKLKASKDKLNVRGDAVEISVLVTDTDGSSQSGKAVTLAIPNYVNNGAYIRGASTVESDENGWAKFTVVVDESLRKANYPTASFVAEDLAVLASVKDKNSTQVAQTLLVDIVNSEVPVPVGSISVNVNRTALSSSSNGIYYNLEGSAQLVDVDGKPIANQDVVLDTRPTSYTIGQYLFAIQKNPWNKEGELNGEYPFDDLKAWIEPYNQYFALKGTIPEKTMTTNLATTCNINVANTSWVANGAALRVVRLIGSDTSHPSTATYRTNNYGRFDFQIEYPKANAYWVDVTIGAKTNLAKTPIHGSLEFKLPASSADYATDGSYAPNRVSPYTTCKN